MKQHITNSNHKENLELILRYQLKTWSNLKQIYMFTWSPVSYVSPAFHSSGMLFTGTTQDSSPSSSLNNILICSAPLGGEVVVHTAPWLRSNSLQTKFWVCKYQKTFSLVEVHTTNLTTKYEVNYRAMTRQDMEVFSCVDYC